MKILSTIHNHCTLCDGKSTAEEMAAAAFDAGFTDFGFSSHAVTGFDMGYSLKDEREYIEKIKAVKKDYSGKMRIYCGIEQDYYAPAAFPEEYSFIIGAVHYIKVKNTYFPMDASPELLAACIDTAFGGNSDKFAEAYFDIVVENVKLFKPDIVAHFDLITKYEADYKVFDDEDKTYRKIALSALDECAKSGAVFEVNTGAMYRANKKTPYPAPFLLKRLNELGARVLLSADSHDSGHLTYGFSESLELIKSCGFKNLTVFEDGRFIDKPID